MLTATLVTFEKSAPPEKHTLFTSQKKLRTILKAPVFETPVLYVPCLPFESVMSMLMLAAVRRKIAVRATERDQARGKQREVMRFFGGDFHPVATFATVVARTARHEPDVC